MTNYEDDWEEDELDEDDAPPIGTDSDTELSEVEDEDEVQHRVHDFDVLASAVSTNAELASFLSGTSKAILIHKAYQHASLLTRGIGSARRALRGRASVGLIVPMSKAPRPKLAEYMRSFPNTCIRMVDPQIHTHAEQYATASETERRNWTYMREPIPSNPSPAWATTLLREQLQAGATVLLTPTGKVDEIHPAAAIDTTIEWLNLCLSIVGDAPLFANLTLPSPWIREASLRNRLLDEIIDHNHRHWYLRVRWPVQAFAYGQLNDPDLLNGYREIAQMCAAEGKVVVFPNSDLTGWICTALGASGFGTGPAASDRSFADPRMIKMPPGRPKPPAKHRYFARSLLHTIEHDTHLSLVGLPGYIACDCYWCNQLAADTGGRPWHVGYSGLHYVHRAALLTGRLGQATDPGAAALRTVTRAQAFVAGIPQAQGLVGDELPRHLDTWQNLLQ